jgi:hypothetical protein
VLRLSKIIIVVISFLYIKLLESYIAKIETVVPLNLELKKTIP